MVFYITQFRLDIITLPLISGFYDIPNVTFLNSLTGWPGSDLYIPILHVYSTANSTFFLREV